MIASTTLAPCALSATSPTWTARWVRSRNTDRYGRQVRDSRRHRPAPRPSGATPAGSGRSGRSGAGGVRIASSSTAEMTKPTALTASANAAPSRVITAPAAAGPATVVAASPASSIAFARTSRCPPTSWGRIANPASPNRTLPHPSATPTATNAQIADTLVAASQANTPKQTARPAIARIINRRRGCRSTPAPSHTASTRPGTWMLAATSPAAAGSPVAASTTSGSASSPNRSPRIPTVYALT